VSITNSIIKYFFLSKLVIEKILQMMIIDTVHLGLQQGWPTCGLWAAQLFAQFHAVFK